MEKTEQKLVAVSADLISRAQTMQIAVDTARKLGERFYTMKPFYLGLLNRANRGEYLGEFELEFASITQDFNVMYGILARETGRLGHTDMPFSMKFGNIRCWLQNASDFISAPAPSEHREFKKWVTKAIDEMELLDQDLRSFTSVWQVELNNLRNVTADIYDWRLENTFNR